jgi:hypothetical protein
MRVLAMIAIAVVASAADASLPLGDSARIMVIAPSGWELVIFRHGSALLRRHDDFGASQMLAEETFDYSKLRREVERLIKAPSCETETQNSDGGITMTLDGPHCYHVAIIRTDAYGLFSVSESLLLRRAFEFAAERASSINARRFVDAVAAHPIVSTSKSNGAR